MKTIILLFMTLVLAACSSTPHKTSQNPDGLTNEELLKVQVERIAKLERDMEKKENDLRYRMEKKENDLRYQHLKEIQALQLQQKPAPIVNTQCKFLCF